jgi:hypothetical protein
MNEEPNNRSKLLPYSQGAENRSALGHTVRIRSASGPCESPFQSLHSSTVSSNARGEVVSLDLGLLQANQTSIPQPIPQGVSPAIRVQNDYESPQYSSASPRNRNSSSSGISKFASKYRPVALMSSTSVLAPMAVGLDPTFVVSDINSHDLNAIDDGTAGSDLVATDMFFAEMYGAYGFTALAEDQYVSAIVKCLKSREEYRVRSCLQEMGMFLKQDKTSEELKNSLLTCWKLVKLFEQDSSSTKGMKTSSLVMIADLLERDGQLIEAEKIYRKVLDLTNGPEDSNIHRISELSLSKILYRLWSPNEEYVREQLEKFTKLLDQEMCETLLHSALAVTVTLTTQFSSIYPPHPCYQLGLVIDRISSSLESQIQGRCTTFDLRFRGLITKLALECSELSWNSTAAVLFRNQRKLLDRLATADWGYVKIRGYIDCCTHFKKHGDWEKYTELIAAAYKTMEDLLYSRSAQLYRTGDIPLLELLKITRAAIPTNKCSQTSIKLIEGMEIRLEKMVAWNQASCSDLGERNVEKNKNNEGEVKNGNVEENFRQSVEEHD